MKDVPLNLKKQLIIFFDMDEINTLTFNLGLDWDELPGNAKTKKVESLLKCVQNNNLQENLLLFCRAERNFLTWEWK